jgi:hypothetical protein
MTCVECPDGSTVCSVGVEPPDCGLYRVLDGRPIGEDWDWVGRIMVTKWHSLSMWHNKEDPLVTKFTPYQRGDEEFQCKCTSVAATAAAGV